MKAVLSQFKLRTKFLLALAVISALLTCAMLLMVRRRVEMRVRVQLGEELRNSLETFQILQRQREETLERAAALMATLPPLMAVMTSQDTATIQDGSSMFWKLSGSQLFVLTDRDGNLLALHSTAGGLARAEAEAPARRSLQSGRTRDWWRVGGHLFQVFLQPIYFGAREENPQIGVLAIGFEVDRKLAMDVSRVASSEVAFRYEDALITTTVPDGQRGGLEAAARQMRPDGKSTEIALGEEPFLAAAVNLSPENSPQVTLTVLKSFDESIRFLTTLNRWILGMGVAGVLAGSVLVFLVSTSFTKPLAELVEGVRSLEGGNFDYPLVALGTDEVSTLTSAFDRMRNRLQASQRQLVQNERLATIGRMATSISHDLRHPLTAILAYAEFLSETRISEDQRKDYFQEIRIAVNRMTDELNSLLGFSKQGEPIRPVQARLEEVIERAIQTVKVLPEFENIEVDFVADGECSGYFDVGKIERVILNLLFNACEAVSPESGRVQITSRGAGGALEIRVADNGPGLPEQVLANLFQPFMSYGKEYGIGLGLTVVQKVVLDHGGTVVVERTGPDGAVFLIRLPARVPVAAS